MSIKIKATGENAADDRIMAHLDNRLLEGHPKPDRKQVSMVLYALADLTTIMEMVQHDRMGRAAQGEDPTKETKWWPTEKSIGRWFQDVADDLEGRFE